MTDGNFPPQQPGNGPPPAGQHPAPGAYAQPFVPTNPAPGAYAQPSVPSNTPPYAAQQPGQTYNVLSIVSLVSAFFVSLVAIITGHIALSQIKRTHEKGRGLALAGVIVGYAGVFFTLVFGIIFAVIFLTGARGVIDSIPTISPSPTLSPTVGDDLDWDAGAALTSSDRPEFLDSFAGDSTWKVASPDDGNGNWSYDTVDGSCTLAFYQGTLPGDVEIVRGDDRASSASFLQYIDGATAGDVSDLASDDTLAFGTGGDGSVDVLSLTGTDKENNNWITAARAFAETGSGLYLDLTCLPSVDLDDVYSSALDNVVVDVP